jgi:hypothetical protein
MPPPVSASVLNEVSPLDIFLRDFPNIERHGASPIQEQASEVIMREGETYPLIEFQNIDNPVNLPIVETDIERRWKQNGKTMVSDGTFFRKGITEESNPMLMSRLKGTPQEHFTKGPFINIVDPLLAGVTDKDEQNSLILHEFLHKTIEEMAKVHGPFIPPVTVDTLRDGRKGTSSLNEEDYVRLFETVFSRGNKNVQKDTSDHFVRRGFVQDQDELLTNPAILKNMSMIKNLAGRLNVKRHRRPPPQTPTIGLINDPTGKWTKSNKLENVFGSIKKYFNDLGRDLRER